MSEKFRLDHKICFQNMFYTKCINVIIDSIVSLIILRSIHYRNYHYMGQLRNLSISCTDPYVFGFYMLLPEANI